MPEPFEQARQRPQPVMECRCGSNEGGYQGSAELPALTSPKHDAPPYLMYVRTFKRDSAATLWYEATAAALLKGKGSHGSLRPMPTCFIDVGEAQGIKVSTALTR